MTNEKVILQKLEEYKYPNFMIEITADKIRNFSPSIASAFQNWCIEDAEPNISIEGYTFNDLRTKWGMNPIGVFITLDSLVKEPKMTIEKLNKGIK